MGLMYIYQTHCSPFPFFSFSVDVAESYFSGLGRQIRSLSLSLAPSIASLFHCYVAIFLSHFIFVRVFMVEVE